MELRSHIFQEKILDPIRLYASFLISLMLVMLLVRGFEIYTLIDVHGLETEKLSLCFSGILNDILFTLRLGVLFYPFFWLAFLVLKPTSEFYSRSILILFVFIYLSIDKYFLEALTPLGADFWGYSYSDLATTVQSSTSFSLVEILAFLMVPIFVLIVYNRLKKIYIVHPIFPVLMVVASVFAMGFSNTVLSDASEYDNEADYLLTENKAKYFLEKSVDYFNEQAAFETANVPEFKVKSYPLLEYFEEPDELGSYLNLDKKPPNLVFILVESLGRSFTGPGAVHGGFTPFLDSLSHEALYWENCISPTGRTFGVLPNVFGSLPFGTDGFNALGDDMPQHMTLLSEAKKLDYKTHYFYGGNVGFDNQRNFLERQNVDYILGEKKFPKRYKKMNANSGGFSWGYSDKDLFELAHETVNRAQKKPRIDVYMSLVNHEPFKVPEEIYHQKFYDRLGDLPKDHRDDFKENKNIFECLLYTDDAVRELIERYKKRSDFENTIFIITGDHRMIPIEHRNAIDRFHVPLLIWSPMLKSARSMKTMVSHSQLAPTFLNLLKVNYKLILPQKMAFINTTLSFDTEFRTSLQQPIMKNKGDLNLYIDKEYFLDNGILYKILPGLELDKVGFRVKKNELLEKLNQFKQINNHVIQNNKLYPFDPRAKTNKDTYTFTQKEYNVIDFHNANEISSDSLLTIAKALFKTDQYDNAITILRYTLNRSPTYADVRIFLGRLLYWQDQNALAEKEFNLAVKHSPQYAEAYTALGYFLYKTDHFFRLNTLMDSALAIEPTNANYLYLKGLAFSETNPIEPSLNLIDSLLNINRNNSELQALKDSL